MKRQRRLRALTAGIAAVMLVNAVPVYAMGQENPKASQSLETQTLFAQPEDTGDSFRYDITEDAFVHDSGSNASVVQALDETNRGTLGIGNSRYIFLRFDLSQIDTEREIESAGVYLYKTDKNGNTVIYDKTAGGGEWTAEDLTAANMPDWEAEPRYQASVSGQNKYVQIDLTELVKEAAENGESDLEIKLYLSESAKYPSGFSSSRCVADDQKPYFEVSYVHQKTDEEKAEEAVREIQSLDGMFVSANTKFPFISQHENGAAVTWESDNDALQTDGTVNEPEDENQEVALTATVTSGSVTKEVVIHVTVLKKQSVSPYAEEALKDLISFTEQSMSEVEESDDDNAAPGTMSKEKGDALRGILKEAEGLLESKSETAYSAYCANIISTGKEYFSSGKISDKIVKTSEENDGNGNLLEYSQYRARLNGLVWAAKAQLLVEPRMYTKAAKRALQEQIDIAESALDGTYHFPFGRNREFTEPRDDEAIQFATDYKVMIHNYNSADYGLEQALNWYKSENIAASTYAVTEVSPAFATYVNHYTNNKDDVYGNNTETIAVGKGEQDRVAMLQFDLSQLPGNVVSAQLKITAKKNGGQMALHLEEDDWDGNTISAKEYEEKYGQTFSSKTLKEFSSASVGTPTVLDVTDAVTGELVNDKKVSFSISAEACNYPVDFYGNAESVDAEYRPVLSVTIASAQPELLAEKYQETVELVEDFMTGAVAGEQPGQYPEKYIKAAEEKLGALKALYESGEKDAYVLGKAMVEAKDAVRDARDNKVLNVDGNLFMDEEDIENIRQKAETVDEYKQLGETVMKTADLYDSGELKNLYQLISGDEIEKLNEEEYKVWSQIKSINFNAPESTASAYIQVSLSPEDYEGNGIGHAWLDDIEIIPSKSENASIPNAGFEEAGEGWTFTEGENTSGKFDSRYAFSGKSSLYIENTGAGATGYWQSDSFPFSQDSCELRFKAKYDDKFIGNGLNIVVHFLDKDGNEIGQTDSLFKNTKSNLILDTDYMSGYQMAAMAYMLTGEEEYAKRSFWYMMLYLDDHLQGVEYWLLTRNRPDGFDNYGGVQEGRNANTLASAYSVIKEADLFEGDENLEQEFYEKVEYLLHDLLDIRDRTEMPVDEVAVGSNNWHTDMSIGAAMLGMAFYDKLDYAQQYIDNGKYIVEGQLLTSVRSDGSWPESIRYHSAILLKLPMFAKSLRYVTGEDWFSAESRVDISKMMKFLVEVQTPACVSGNIDTPVIGDDAFGAGNKFNVLGCYWDEVMKNNPELGQQMYETWVKAGKPVGIFGSEDNMIQNFFLNPDFADEYKWNDEYALTLKSDDYAAPWGLYQLRNRYGTGEDSYLAFVANEQAIGHNHFDQLSFSLYYNSTPIVVDPGIETYFGSSKGTYTSTGSHATVQFSNEKGFVNLGTTSYDRNFVTSELMDQVSASTDCEGATLKRTIAYAKTGQEIYVVRDQISGAEYPTRWNLPVLAENLSVVDNSRIDIQGFNGLNMTVLLLEGVGSVETEQIRGAGAFPLREGNTSPLVDVIHANAAEGTNGYLSILIPYSGEKTDIQYEVKDTPAEGYRIYIIKAGESEYSLAVNDTDSAQIMDLGEEEYTVLTDGSKAEGQVGVASGEMLLLKKGSTAENPDEGGTPDKGNKPDEGDKPDEGGNPDDGEIPNNGNTPDDGDKGKTDPVRTGDSLSIFPFVSVILAGGTIMAVLLIRRKKKH